jgi:hypothetical protein
MCDTRLPSTPRPRWGDLHARLLGAAAAGLLVAAWPLDAALRITLAGVVMLAAARMTLGWLRANAPALDLAAWRACTPGATSVRVVVPACRPHRRRRRRRATLTR